MEDPVAATESSRIPSIIERSPMDFVNENPSQQSAGGNGMEDQGQETVAPEVPPPENVTTTGVAPETSLVEIIAAIEMMITTTAFIRGEVTAASKKKGHTSWRTHDQSKRQNSEKRKVPAATTYGDPSRKEKHQQVFATFITIKGAARVWFDELPPESIDSYKDLMAAFLAYFMQQKKGLLVIEAEIARHIIHRMYVDGVSSTEVLYEHCFNRLRPEVKNQMVPETTSLSGFSRETIWPLGQLRLLVTIRDADHSTRAWINFMISSDMTRVPQSVAEHRLNIRDGYSPVRQKKRGHALKRAKAIQAEVQKLVEAGIMREVYYHDWFSNPVMVKNHDDSWRMCVDFIDLKKACPQDCYPLLKIDWKVESLCGYPFKCFLKAYKGYHQIQLAESDEEKKAFHTGQGVYCYIKMPLGLKNAGTTYQRLYGLDDRKRDGSDTSLLRKPRITGPGTELYSNEKLVLSLFFTAKRLRSVMLGEHNITYRPRTLVKGQVLADFLAELPDESPPDVSVVETQQEPWTLFTNGSSCVDGSGAGLILTSPEGAEFTYVLRFQFAASNNEAEYEALIAGLRIAAQMGMKNVHVSVDSKLVANQVLGAYVTKEENMIKYLKKVKSLVSGFTNFAINQVQRSKNKKADAPSKIVSINFAYLSKQVLVEIFKEKSIQENEVTTVVEEDGPTWMTLIIEYLKEGTFPSDRKEARKLRIKARQYELLEGVLYRRSFFTSWLRCVGPLQADYVIREIHEGSCSMHARPRSVVAEAIRLGYYWPTMHQDTRDDTYMQRLSNTSSHDKKPPAASNPDHGFVAVLQVGN
nr:reverse transcriptase domain-containing protein [Tanacetum cinerariifolium]